MVETWGGRKGLGWVPGWMDGWMDGRQGVIYLLSIQQGGDIFICVTYGIG